MAKEDHAMQIIESRTIPGTILERSKMDGADGMEFLDKVFFITNGIMLTQIREITGIDGTTLQNWLKRGWVASPEHKLYSKEHLARILLINIMRDTLQLSQISGVLRYINVEVDTTEDDIITESALYDYVCRVIAILADENSAGLNAMEEAIRVVTAEYTERFTGARARLETGLNIIVSAYYGSLVKQYTDALVENCCGKTLRRKRP